MKRFFVSSAVGALLAISATCALATDIVGAVAILGGSPFAVANYGINVVKGVAILTSSDDGKSTNVIVKISGLKPGTTHIGHVHGGTCPQLAVGTILQSLTPVTVDEYGRGSSQTKIPADMHGLNDCGWWIAVHEGPENTSPQSPAVAVGPVIIDRFSR